VAKLANLEDRLDHASRETASVVQLGIEGLRAQLNPLSEQSPAIWAELRRLSSALDAVRSRAELSPQAFLDLARHRRSPEYQHVFSGKAPLVTIGIATYNRARLLTERCLPSVLSQDYPNFEVVVVGDCCTDETEDLVRGLRDPRIRFQNLERHTEHPEDPERYWLTGGGPCGNHVRALAAGDLITQLDDDDEYLPGRISRLVAHLQETKSEVVWHPFWYENSTGEWQVHDASEFRLGQVTTGSVMYLSWFKRFDWHPDAYRGLEPADWYRFRKMKYAGAKLARYPEPLLRHYRERNQTYLTGLKVSSD
jgi:glycosyltransferase involved in cell wall biosynthesis